MYATLGVFQWLQFKVKLNESKKNWWKKKKMETKNDTEWSAVVLCYAVTIMSIQHFKVNVEWISIHAISTLKALPFWCIR